MLLKRLWQRLAGLASSVVRFPVTVAFLTASAVLTAFSISGEEELLRYILTGIVGAVACAACQALYERFFSGAAPRIGLYIAGIVVTGLFYLSARGPAEGGLETATRFAVMVFALFIALIWFGVVRGPRDFGESFMAAFKALFEAAFFSGVLFLGCVLIIAAIDRLITPVDEDAYMYTANIVFMIIAPLILLSLIPVYPGKSRGKTSAEQEAVVDRRTGCPKFLEVLLSYIVIPLTGIFTIILLAYIFLNIGGEFWTNNLLEPMLVAYTITVIVVTILVGRLENRTARVFIKIFPKVLIPIALFQIVASALLLHKTGMTFGRYFVLLYGAFAVFAGIALSLPKRAKVGIIAPVLIILSAVSLVPPVDAFTVSRMSQIAALEQTLAENGMLENNTVTPNSIISDTDKEKIVSGIEYLEKMDALDEVPWLPDGFEVYNDSDFNQTFGFGLYASPSTKYPYISVYFDMSNIIPVSGYDVCTQMAVPGAKRDGGTDEKTFVVENQTYTLFEEQTGGGVEIGVRDAKGAVLGRLDTDEVFSRYASYPPDKNVLTLEEAAFSAENDALVLKIVVLDAWYSAASDQEDRYAQLLVLVDIK